MTGGSTATATLTGISPVGTGIHLVDASYQGDINYSGSVSATTPLVAERVVTTLSLTANLSGNGEQFLLTATLTPNEAQNHNASGMVTFYNNNVSLGQGTVANGVATLTATLPFGSDSITAMYPGDTNFDAVHIGRDSTQPGFHRFSFDEYRNPSIRGSRHPTP